VSCPPPCRTKPLGAEDLNRLTMSTWSPVPHGRWGRLTVDGGSGEQVCATDPLGWWNVRGRSWRRWRWRRLDHAGRPPGDDGRFGDRGITGVNPGEYIGTHADCQHCAGHRGLPGKSRQYHSPKLFEGVGRGWGIRLPQFFLETQGAAPIPGCRRRVEIRSPDYGQTTAISKGLFTGCIGLAISTPVAVPEIVYELPSFAALASPWPVPLW